MSPPPGHACCLLPLHGAELRPLREAGICGGARVTAETTAIDGRTPVPDAFLLFLVLAGRARYDTGPARHDIEAGQVAFFPEFRPRHWRALAPPMAALAVNLDPDRLDPGLREAPSTVRPAGQAQHLDHAFQAIVRESGERRLQGQRQALAANATLFTIHLQRELEGFRSPAVLLHHERLDALWQAIIAAPAEAWTVERMARLAGVSRSRLYALVSEHYGSTPAERVARIRIEQAAALLASTAATIKQVAETVGYADAFALSKAFLRLMGERPGAWRRRYRLG